MKISTLLVQLKKFFLAALKFEYKTEMFSFIKYAGKQTCVQII